MDTGSWKYSNGEELEAALAATIDVHLSV